MEAHVAAFIQRGVQEGDTVITIATKERREGFAQSLRTAYPGVEGKIDVLSSYRALDADEVLATFLVDTRPERSRFFATMDQLFSKPARDGRPIRVFGEMVTRLWQAGIPMRPSSSKCSGMNLRIATPFLSCAPIRSVFLQTKTVNAFWIPVLPTRSCLFHRPKLLSNYDASFRH